MLLQDGISLIIEAHIHTDNYNTSSFKTLCENFDSYQLEIHLHLPFIKLSLFISVIIYKS